jgi:tetratricopeptide (TPR) repeat protein
MKKVKAILILLIQLFAVTVCFAQTVNIDSLYRELRNLKDSSKVDCYNILSYGYILLEKRDSAKYFANLAFAEAKKINYGHGIAVSYIRKARIAKHFDDDFIQSEHLALQSLSWYGKTANHEGLYDVYSELSNTVGPQSRFSEGEYYANKMYELSKEKNDEAGMSEALGRMYVLYKDAGNYEKSFDYCLRFQQLAEKTNNRFQHCTSFFALGGLYMKLEDYRSALKCFREAFKMDTPEFEIRRRNEDWDIWVKMEHAEIFSHLKLFDSAWHYFELYKPAKVDDRYYRIYLVSTGEYYFLQKKYDTALNNFLRGLDYHKKLNDQNEIQRCLIFIAETYFAIGDNEAALKFAQEALQVASQTKAKQIIRDGYQILYSVYDRRHQTDSANFYFRQYMAMKESVANDQVKGKFAVFGYEQQIAMLDKEKQLQDQRLRQTTLQMKFLIAGIGAVCLIGIILFRNLILKRKNERLRMEHALKLQQLESEKTKADLQQQATELEMQALRAQMNPHFIFNSLNSINKFILQNNKAMASEYLTKFSKLVRMILQNSQASLITLESELEALELYLDLEALRFEHHFDYKISVPKNLDIEVMKVPPLIIQPYAENAIWHGLMHKEEKGHLDIEVRQQNDQLFFKITDDGIGRKQSAALNSRSATKHKSVGLKITAERIAMMQSEKGNESAVTINDLVNPDGSVAGTEVIIKIPVIYT